MRKAVILILGITICLYSCKKDDISNLNLETSKKIIISGSYVKLNCKSNFDKNSKVSYQWSCNNGEFGTSINSYFQINNNIDSNIVTWHAPYQVGKYQVCCTVFDSNNNIIGKISNDIDVIKPDYSIENIIYTNQRLINDMVYINKDSILTIKIAVLSPDLSSKISNDKLILINKLNIIDINDLPLGYYFYNYGASYGSNITIDNKPGSLPIEIQVKMQKIGDNIYITNARNSLEIVNYNIKTKYVGTFRINWNYYQLLDLKVDKYNQLIGITSPRYDGNGALINPPIIWNMSNFESPEKIYEFPFDYDYSMAGTGDGYPDFAKYSLAFDSKNNTYVAIPNLGKIFRLDTSKILSTFKDDIFCPSSIAIADNDYIYVTSAPKYSHIDYNWYMIKPLEILYLDEVGNKISIANINNNYLDGMRGGLIYNKEYNCYFNGSTFQHDIKLDENYGIYFIDSRSGFIKLFN